MRLVALKAVKINNCRCFSGSHHLRNSNNELLSLLGQAPQPPPVQKSKRILILKPEQTKDKIISKFMTDQKDRRREDPKHERSYSQSVELPTQNIQNMILENEAGIVESVEQLKPKHGEPINSIAAKDLSLHLAKSFTKAQMLEYLDLKAVKKAPKSYTKAKLGEYIVKHIWKSKLDHGLHSTMLYREQMTLSNEELFYLTSQNGQLTLILKAAVASLKIDQSTNELFLGGTEYQISNAKVNLYSHFSAAHKEEIDLKSIQALYIEKFGKADFGRIGKANDVYFKHIAEQRYQLCSLKRQNIERVKRLIVWNLDYNLHQKNFLHLPPENELSQCQLLQRADPLSSNWIGRTKAHFELTYDNQRRVSSRLRNELKEFSSLDFENLDFKEDPYSAVRNTESIEDETFDILETLGFLKDDSEAGIHSNFSDQEHSLEHDTVQNSKLELLQPTRDGLYSQLSDFEYRQNLRGVSDNQLDSHIFTITLGRTSFTKEKAEHDLFVTPPQLADLSNSFSFDTNIQLVYDAALSQSVASEDIDPLQDPHQYSMQFKFVPTPSEAANGSLAEQMKYPPIEMWVALNERSVLDLETIQLVSVEGENNAFVCLPKQNSDLKLTCQITGQVLDQRSRRQEDEEANVLGSTADKFVHLSSQPGVREFLAQLTLDFSGKIKPSMAPRMKVLINGKEVDYTFVNLRHRKELTLSTDERIIVQLSTIDGGFLGGRRCEVRFIGDLTLGLSRESFDHLLDYGVKFLNSL